MERGGGVAVESEGESAAGAELLPLAAFLPRPMFDMAVVMGRREKERNREGEERERRTCDLAEPAIENGKSAPLPVRTSSPPLGPLPTTMN